MQIKRCHGPIIKSCIIPCLYVLVTLQIFIGLMVIVACEYFKNVLGRYVPEVEQNEIDIKLFLFELFGCNVFLSYIGGFPLLKRLSDLYTSHLCSLLKLWQFFIFTASLNGMLSSYMLNGSSKYLKQTIEATLYRGIELYYTDPEWRLIWDGFQYNEQCCGVTDFRDWQSLAWMINQDERTNSDEDSPLLTPHSCCKKDNPCYGSALYQKTSANWAELSPTINMTLINEDGCLRIFFEKLDDICVTIFIIVGIVCLMQILILTGMVILIHRKAFRTKRMSNHQSQTDLPTGTPIPTNGYDSLEIIHESDDDGYVMLQRKMSNQYIFKSGSRKNRVEFVDVPASNDETQNLLIETTN